MAKKAYSPDPKAETIKRIQRTEAYAEKVRQLFAATVNEILALFINSITISITSSNVLVSSPKDSISQR